MRARACAGSRLAPRRGGLPVVWSYVRADYPKARLRLPLPPRGHPGQRHSCTRPSRRRAVGWRQGAHTAPNRGPAPSMHGLRLASWPSMRLRRAALVPLSSSRCCGLCSSRLRRRPVGMIFEALAACSSSGLRQRRDVIGIKPSRVSLPFLFTRRADHSPGARHPQSSNLRPAEGSHRSGGPSARGSGRVGSAWISFGRSGSRHSPSGVLLLGVGLRWPRSASALDPRLRSKT